jgi:plasmid stability protein
MGEMNIRINDDNLIERLSGLARAHNRSPESEALEILIHGVGAIDKFDRLANAQRISAMTPKGVKQTDSVELIRQDRDR